MSTYQIIDEPKPSGLSKLTVNPMWILFGYMIGGSIFSWIWFALNGQALNGANIKKERVTLLVGVVLLFLSYAALGYLIQSDLLLKNLLDYYKLAIVVMELTICYRLYLYQQSTYGVFEYFEQKGVNPIYFMILALVIGKALQLAVVTLFLTIGAVI